MSTQVARSGCAFRRHIKHILLCNICVLALGAPIAAAASSAPTTVHSWHKPVRKRAERESKLPFGDIPKGPLEILISIHQQRLYFYSDGVHVADAPVATGVPGHLTPLGVFSVIQRDRYHHSNIYSNAPMPYMERITWSGVALHEGPGVGHQASHGCIRMPGDFAARLWRLPTMGMRVIIAGPELRPLPFADSHLFVHTDAPPSPPVAVSQPVQTAQKGDPVSRTDGADPAVDGSHGAPADPQSAAAVTADKSAPHQIDLAPRPGPQATPQPAPAAAGRGDSNQATATAAPTTPGVNAPVTEDDVPIPPAKPRQIGNSSGPIAIFISRKTSKIYVRQDFTPVFDAPVKIENPDQPFGTHVFTAMDYLPDHSTLRWTVVSLPGTAAKTAEHWKYVRDRYGQVRRVRVQERETAATQPPDTPEDALARIEIPQDAIAQISRLILPGSSLTISDQGLGPETGAGTDFIVVTR